MSFTINGITWTPKTASEHATAMLTEMNALLQAQGLQQIVATPANAVWLILLAVGAKMQTQDENIAQAINSFNIPLASDQQVQNLLPMAGTTLIPGTYSTVSLEVTAAAGTCTVPSGTLLPFGTVNFATASGISIPASGIGTVQAVCDTIGPIVVLPNQLTAFGTNIANLSSVTNPAAAVVGRDTETANEARQRLLNGETIGWNLNGVQEALSRIDGITQVKVYFNQDTVNDLILTGGMIVYPRHCRIIIAGTDLSGTSIASTYLSLITPPTDGALSQTYTFLSGQIFEVFYDEATTQNIYVRVYYNEDVEVQSGFAALIESTVQAIPFTIGQTVTTDTILDSLYTFTAASLTGAEVSLDGVTWGRKITVDGDAIPNAFSVEVIGE